MQPGGGSPPGDVEAMGERGGCEKGDRTDGGETLRSVLVVGRVCGHRKICGEVEMDVLERGGAGVCGRCVCVQ